MLKAIATTPHLYLICCTGSITLKGRGKQFTRLLFFSFADRIGLKETLTAAEYGKLLFFSFADKVGLDNPLTASLPAENDKFNLLDLMILTILNTCTALTWSWLIDKWRTRRLMAVNILLTMVCLACIKIYHTIINNNLLIKTLFQIGFKGKLPSQHYT